MAAKYLSAERRTRKPRIIPPLENGDRLDQKTFHDRYEAMPEHVRAQLIGGIVYMASPQKSPHGQSHGTLGWWLGAYVVDTPGTDCMLNTTDILGPESEPEPDGCLIILPEHGGQTWLDEEGYLCGPPELAAEVSWSSESIDLNAKKSDYEKQGILEYLVVALRQEQIYWFVRRRGKFRALEPGPDGILRSENFPGLWLDPPAFLGRKHKRLSKVLQQGLASPKHALFVEKLAAQK
jgi:hypothetical protein